jgi:hypothetical protein
MTDYVPYTPDEYAPDAPGTALHFQRWFENWIAGFEGASGAPRFHPLAFGEIAAGDVVIDRLTPQGIAVQLASFSSGGSASGTVTKNYVLELPVATVCNNGVLRIKGTLASTGTFRIYKNGTLITSQAVGSFSYDLTVAAGDQIHFGATLPYSFGSGGGSASNTITNLQICGDALKNWRY